ncbi:DNase I-like protein [Peniophora sp. CONT]|nr:DNase I-like protein [Peniophora sp. CONT]
MEPNPPPSKKPNVFRRVSDLISRQSSPSPVPNSPETSTKRKPPPPPGPPLTPSSSNPSLRSPSPYNGHASPFNGTPTQSPAPVSSPFGSPAPTPPARKVQPPPLPRRSQGSGTDLGGNSLGFENGHGAGNRYGSEDETVFASPVKVHGGTAARGGPGPGSLSSFDSSSSSDSIPHANANAYANGRDYSPHPPPAPRLDKRPPPRHHASLASTHSTHSSSSINSVGSEPPALPARRSTAEETGYTATAPAREFLVSPPPPRRNVPPHHAQHQHPQHVHPQHHAHPSVQTQQQQPIAAQAPVHTSLHAAPPPGPPPAPAPSLSAGKAIKHQPPPTRTIGLHEPLPELRRSVASAGSSEDSEDESGDEELQDPRLTQAPDTSRASRRRPAAHPHAFDPSGIHVMHGAALAIAGSLHAVAGQHHVRIFDLDVQETPRITLDGRDVGLAGRALVASSLCWSGRGRGKRWLWIGTKDGHLFEFDVELGVVAGQKLAAHSSAVQHILRYGSAMATIDDGGKMLIFDSSFGGMEEGEAGMLSRVQPRVCRIAEKQSFVKVFGGRVWTSAKEKDGDKDARGPVVRIYDVFTGGNPGAPPRSILPTEPLGAVMCGGIVPSEAGRVFLGHEGGCVSVWSTLGTGLPECIDVVKVGATDILALEGVHDKLWTSGRGGRINAYDVSHRPWVQTASWSAHNELPISRLVVDVVGVGEGRGMKVVSCGRDEKMAFWDGLLGADWLDEELLKRESAFASFRDLEVLIVSWNLDAVRPDDLRSPASVNVLHEMLSSSPVQPDIIAFGFQETINLESKSTAMRQVFRGGGGTHERKVVRYGADAAVCSAKDEKATTAYRRWYEGLQKAVRLAFDARDPYVVVHTENLVGLFSCVLVRQRERTSIRDVGVSTVKRGAGGRYGNKGGIVCRMTIDDTSIALVNAHLAAGQNKVRSRNADLTAIIEGKGLFQESEEAVERDGVAYVGGGDGSTVLDHEIVFFQGDLNYRIDARRDAIVAAVDNNDYLGYLQHDQLSKEMRFNRGFRLRGFLEGGITFAPTYKYDPHSTTYDTSEKRRSPAWCDRVLWRAMSPERVRLRQYRRYEPDVSDHRPVSASFRMTVKSVRQDERAGVKSEMVGVWRGKERALVDEARKFYVGVGLLLADG